MIKVTKINIKNIKKIDKQFKDISEKKIKIGITGDEKSEDGTYVRDYAFWNEYGTSKIPARPFFRTALIFPKARGEVNDYVEKTLKEVLKGNITGLKSLDKIGLYCKGRVIKSISSGNWEPLSESTIKNKGKSKPLVDKGNMIKSVDYEVVKNG